MVKILLTHPNIKTNIKNYENRSPRDCIAEYVKEIIEPEFIKIEKRNKILELATQEISNYAYAFLLTGVLVFGLSFKVDNPVLFALAALTFFAIGVFVCIEQIQLLMV